MLDNFKEKQPIAYKIVTNSVKKNKNSHAYIIENSDNKEAFDFAISFAKLLFCPYGYSNSNKCGTCKQCQNIDENNYLELKIINYDDNTNIIKKQELSDLQQIFKNKALIGNKKIYIINNAEKLNLSSANALLKFLEEPADNIIAILTTKNVYNVIPTILSRCQLIILKGQSKDLSLLNHSEENEELISNCLKFIYLIEKKKTAAICYINNNWNNYFKEKDKCILGLDIMNKFYKTVLDSKLSIPNNTFSNNGIYINEIKELNTIRILCNKIKVIIKSKEKLKQNANTSLLMDKLIIELKRCEENA